MARYLVTGGAGFIGSHLVDKLIEQNHQVTILDDLSAGKRENVNPKARLVIGDIKISLGNPQKAIDSLRVRCRVTIEQGLKQTLSSVIEPEFLALAG